MGDNDNTLDGLDVFEALVADFRAALKQLVDQKCAETYDSTYNSYNITRSKVELSGLP